MKQSIQIWLASAIALYFLATADKIQAQIVPDATLPSNSNVTQDGKTNIITGGTVAGSNLFHSFEQFSVPTESTAYFNNTLDIQNIISRVTGDAISNIDGLIRANGTANLFLLNPNGIIFDPNASLNIGGSFLASTASSLNLADGSQFSATVPQTTPLPPLLTVSVPLGLQFGQTAGSILNQSQAIDRNGAPVGLQVQPGKTLALVGGNVSLEGATMLAPGGRVELGGVAAEGTVGLSFDSNNLRLSFPDDVARADVSLDDGTFIGVAAGGGGSIAINAQNIDVLGGSYLLAGIDYGLGAVGAQAGDITLDAKGALAVGQSSNIVNDVNPNATGNSGNIDVKAESLSIENAFLSASMFGQGNVGSVLVQANNSVSLSSGTIYNSVESGGVGNTGGIFIDTGSLSLSDGAALSASTSGQGNAGSINITARDTVSFAGSAALSDVEREAVGNSGGINIMTESLSLTNGAFLAASTFGQGNAGSININARDTISFDDESSGGLFSSGAFSQVEQEAVGNSGGINITTGLLSVTNSADISTSTFGQGNAGSININARDTVSFVGSGAFSEVLDGSAGKSGNINITTGSLSVTNGAFLNASTRGQGDAGSVNINAHNIVSFDRGYVSSTVESTAKGKGGEINITTGSLSMTADAQLIASTNGQGDAGNVTINARDSVSIDGILSAVSSSSVTTDFIGNGGNIDITTGSLAVTNGAFLNASTRGQGDAGDVTINARNTISFAGGEAFSTVEPEAEGKGGNINVTTGSLSVTNGAFLSASTEGQGDSGDVTIAARDRVSFDGVSADGFPSGAYSQVLNDAKGQGGNIQIATESLSLTNGAALSASISSGAEGLGGDIYVSTGLLSVTNGAFLTASSDGLGDAGNVTINARDTVIFDGEGEEEVANSTRTGAYSRVLNNAEGQGGDLYITTPLLSLLDGAILTASTSGKGDAGSITIDASNTVSFNRSNVFSSVEPNAVGNGGGINITTDLLSVTNSSRLSTNSAGSGAAGNIEVEANSIHLDNRATLSSNTVEGQGNIFLRSEDLVLRRGSDITTNATGAATGGSITIDTDILSTLEDSDISANAQAAFGGQVLIDAQAIFRTQESNITATSELGSEFSGIVELNTLDVDLSRGTVSLPTVPVEPEVAQACTPGGSQQQSEFVITGRGGLPPNPTEALSSDAVEVDWVTLNPGIEDTASPASATNPTNPAKQPIVEAQGWVINNQGEVILTASAAPVPSRGDWQTRSDCHAAQSAPRR